MKQSVYLHTYIVDILRCYGTLETVINRILEEAAAGNFDVMDKPACPDRKGAGRYDVEILEPNYLELLSVYSPFSSKISLRRLIYWFVENEIYEELGWEQLKEFENKKTKSLLKKLQNATNEIERAKCYSTSKTVLSKLTYILTELSTLQEYLKNE